MSEEEEARLVQRVMEDSMNTYDERHWVGLEDMMALSAADDVAIPKEQPVAVKEEMVQGVRAERWCPTPPRSLESESSPRGEVVQATPALPTFQGPSAHLGTMPPYIDLTSDDDDNDDA
ncbi:hypothetical protein D1007_28846 [Hordeum vulgare]|nr:hypothetical protein D1007_28846 [Hordeum vulgare]